MSNKNTIRISEKIYADSSLRHANQLSLNADINGMSGGGIGQVVNAIQLDAKYEEVVIYAGNNEIKGTEPIEEFVYTIEKAGDKLQCLANETKVKLVLPATPTISPDEMAKARYLEEKVAKIEAIETIKVTDIEYEFDHPTEKGTLTIIKQVETAIGEPLVPEGAEDVDKTTHRKYSQIIPIYKVGCRGCDKLDFTPQLCTYCKEAAKSCDATYLRALIEHFGNQLFPVAEHSDTDMDTHMRGITKRGQDEEYSEGEKNPKNARNDA